jgi:hypothetical protein
MGMHAAARLARPGGLLLPLCVLLGAVLAYVSITSILSGRIEELAYVCIAIVVVSFVLMMLKNWRTGLYLFLTWLLFEDLIRKYMGNNMAIYFGKDAMIAVVYISFFAALRRKEAQRFRPPFLIPFLVFFWFGVIQVFNPGSPSIFFGLLGLKLYFYYVPLVLIGYALLDSEEDLRKFFGVNLALAAIIGTLGIIQAVLGHTFLNPEHPQEDIRLLSELYRPTSVAGVNIYRPTSVFVSDGRFTSYMMLAWIMAFGFGGYLLLRSRKGRFLSFACLGIISLAIVLGGGRGPLLWTAGSALICAAAFLWGAPWRQGEVLRVIRSLQRALLIGGLALLIFFFAYPDALLSRFAFYSETLSLDSPTGELIYRARDYPIQNFLNAFQNPRWPYGYGTGTASLGVQYVARILHYVSPAGGTENGFGSIVLEMGILGLLLWLFWTSALVVAGWNVVRKLRGSPWFPLGFAIVWFTFLLLLPMTYNGLQVYQNFVMNAYLWLLIGVLFRLPHLALTAQSSAAAAQKPHLRAG